MVNEDNLGSVFKDILEFDVEGSAVLLKFTNAPVPEDVQEIYGANYAAQFENEPGIVYLAFVGRDVNSIDGNVNRTTSDLIAELRQKHDKARVVRNIVSINRYDPKKLYKALEGARKNLDTLTRLITKEDISP